MNLVGPSSDYFAAEVESRNIKGISVAENAKTSPARVAAEEIFPGVEAEESLLAGGNFLPVDACSSSNGLNSGSSPASMAEEDPTRGGRDGRGVCGETEGAAGIHRGGGIGAS